MASPGNQHCAKCIGTLSFPIRRTQAAGQHEIGRLWSSLSLQSECQVSRDAVACRHRSSRTLKRFVNF